MAEDNKAPVEVLKTSEVVVAPVESKPKFKCLTQTGFGGNEKLKVGESELRDPTDNEVLVRVKVAGINFADIMIRQGLFFKHYLPKTPFTPGFEASGIIEKVGTGCEKFKVGDRVIVLAPNGMWSDIVYAEEKRCFAMPESMTFEDGAAMAMNYLSAYIMIVELANVKQGQTVLIHHAAGGVGVAAVQICRSLWGSDVTILGTATESKHERLKELGVTHPIDYRRRDYVLEVKKVAPEGVDVILDALGGADSEKGFKLLKPLGKIVFFGLSNMIHGEKRSLLRAAKTFFNRFHVTTMDLIATNRTCSGFSLLPLLDKMDTLQGPMNKLFSWYGEGKIHPVIDSTLSYTKVGEALNRLSNRENVGKCLVTFNEIQPEPTPATTASPAAPAPASTTTVITTTITETTAPSSEPAPADTAASIEQKPEEQPVKE